MSAVENPVVVAIDGTSASGKSTNAKLVARALGYVYIDTGAMYRTLAWHCLRKSVDVHDEKAVANLCRRWKTELVCIDNHVRLLVDGYFPEKEIRTAETSAAVPHVAAIPKVRDWMKKKQRECVQFGNLVMEGRDIGTVVFPVADVKVYLDAAPDERARRRANDPAHSGVPSAVSDVQSMLSQRDEQDRTRTASPLYAAPDAIVVDTTGKNVDEVVREVMAVIDEKVKT